MGPLHEIPDGLLERARAGDQSAWDELFRTCYPKVIRAVRRKLARPMRSLYDSTDFASDVMKSLAANLERLDFLSIESLMVFLARAAEQKVIDEYRRRHTLKRDIDRDRPATSAVDSQNSPREFASAEPTPSQWAQASEVRERLFAGQSESERAVIELRQDGFSNAEIAERTGWNIRKVQRFLSDLHDSIVGRGGHPC